MILITQNDFTERTGIDLSADVREDGITSDRQAQALIERWERYVYKTAHRFNNCIDSDKLNDWVSIIKLANKIILELLDLLIIKMPTEM